MKTNSLWIAFCASLLLMACTPKDNPLIWTEDVVTPDGRIVPLKRVQYFDEGDFVGKHSFEFEHPTTKQIIKWESDPFINFSLTALFFVDEKAHILVHPRFGIDGERAGCPYPSAMIFKWNGNQWEQVPYKESPLTEIRNNTSVDPKSDRRNIQQSGYRLAAGTVTKYEHGYSGYSSGLTLKKYPTQIFQCPAQQKVKFK